MANDSTSLAQEATSQPAEAEPTINFLGLEAAPLTEPLVTDRPDFTESTLPVPFGHVQLETGYTFTYDDEDGRRVSDQTFPEALMRIGVVKDWELRLGWTGWSLTEELFMEENDSGRKVRREEHDDGGTDMIVGFKRYLLPQEGLRPELGVIGELSLPTGTDTKSSGDVDPQVKILWSYELPADFALSGNLNLAVPTSEEGRFFQTSASVSLAYSLTDWMGMYVEYFGFYPNDRWTDCAHTVNGGFTFLITDNLQFDVRTGAGLNEEADDFFTGAGLSMRF
ncbi:MAG TPA: transporter [Phycisphaerae bacterium]|nr:transporter [Phycisphaerae bacterium]